MDLITQKIDGKNLFIVSDLHIGDGTEKDNFRVNAEAFEAFLDYVESRPDYCIIFNGDIFEFWQCNHGDIFRHYFPLIQRMINMNSIFVVGNHDIDFLGFVGLVNGYPFFDSLVGGLVIEKGGKKIRIMHGNEFDKFNNPKKSMFVGRVCSLLASWAEMKWGTDLGYASTESMLEKITVWFVRLFSGAYLKFNKTPASKGKKGGFYENILEYHKKYRENILVMGHTHEPGDVNMWYYNSGFWGNRGLHYIVINNAGDIMVREWPSQKQVFIDLNYNYGI